MLQDKASLDEYLAKEIDKKSFDLIQNNVVDYIYEKHGVPKSTMMDYVTERKPMQEADPATEYAILEAIIEVADTHAAKQRTKEVITTYFTELERGKFSTWKIASDSTPTEFRIPCFQVSSRQWIGSTDIHFFMTLRDAQKLRYNENAQRIMKRINRGNSVEYAISVNWNEVKDIQKKYREEQFIPNVLTLNIPEDVETDFEYDEKTKELIFHNITYLDITDGYHRYLAACAEYDRTEGKFNYPIEIRIINFSDKKARDFVYQETLGTRMKKAGAQSMNSSSPANFVVDKLNEDSNLEGLIKRNGGLIDYSDISFCLQEIVFNEYKSISRPELISITKDIVRFYNNLTDENTALLERSWYYLYILSSVVLLKWYIELKPDNKKKYRNIFISDNFIKGIASCLKENTATKYHSSSIKPPKSMIGCARNWIEDHKDNGEYL